jgi:hypothetical protein
MAMASREYKNIRCGEDGGVRDNSHEKCGFVCENFLHER